VDAARAPVESQGHLCQKKIAQKLGIHRETVKRILRDDLHPPKVNFKWIPQTLDSSLQKLL
jgi:DNA-binding transcriptional regulator LsrR (DeoR family)